MSKSLTLSQSPEETSFLLGVDARFLSELYARYLENPTSVDPSWAHYFRELGDKAVDLIADRTGPSWTPKKRLELADPFADDAPAKSDKKAAKERLSAETAPPAASSTALEDVYRVMQVVESYRRFGHFAVQLDPLGLTPAVSHPELSPEFHGFKAADLDRSLMVPFFGENPVTVRQVVAWAQSVYMNTIGYDFAHLSDTTRRLWLQERIEAPVQPLSREDLKAILQGLTQAESFERFLHVKFPGAKRFGLEGGDATIPLLEAVLRYAVSRGVKEVVLGMAHRGRLNVLTNVTGKPYGAVFSEFRYGVPTPEGVRTASDVKYHMGFSCDRDVAQSSVHLSLLPNPSHLEAVDPVVLGKVRSRQEALGNKALVLGVLIHGEAAFAGQGIVAETLAMSQLEGYRTGGTYHIIINNQVGFTADPYSTRSTHYASDSARGFEIPIFHVNGDDPEAVIRAGLLAAEFRDTFHSDVVIDLLCYRRHGHNESDEPAFTQPRMYQAIAKHPTPRKIFADRLVAGNIMTQTEVEQVRTDFEARLQQDFEKVDTFKNPPADWLKGRWSKIKPHDHEEEPLTGIDLEQLKAFGKAIFTIPEGFELNPKIARQLEQKRHMFESGEGFDWATGEALAFASLLADGHKVRLSGQDVGRGTFSHRHGVWTDQNTQERYIPLNHLQKKQGHFESINSLLSEEGVLGFEYGYSIADPDALVLWEAQFGDFANGAQMVIDQFISAAESKWLRKSGLVMLLPHGFEGQGPEHSSARLERYLQLCAEENMRVLNCTTPANYFHALRRQLVGQTRKPLIMMTPKSLLRLKAATSTLNEFGPETTFQPVLPDRGVKVPADVKRVLLCSGKVYYDLHVAREEEKMTQAIALVRVEQFYPFPAQQLEEVFKAHPKAEVVWCQEEPENMGAWSFLNLRLEALLTKIKHASSRPRYIGRPEAASPAVGSDKRHTAEQELLVKTAVKL